MAQATIRRLIEEYSGADQAAIIDDLVKDSGLLMSAQAIPSTHGSFHKYKKTSALPTGAHREINGGYSAQTVDNNIYQLDLKLFGAVQSEDASLCEEIGVANYFMQQRPAFLEGLSQGQMQRIIYGVNSTHGDVSGFKGWHEYAEEYGNVIEDSGTSGSTTSIFAVHYRPGRNGIVFNSKLAADGLFRQKVMNNGQSVLQYNSTTGLYQPVYQVLYETSMAWLNTTKYDIAVYKLLQDDTDDRPTSDNMDKLLDLVKAGRGAGYTVLYGNTTSRRLLYKLKNSKMDMMPNDFGYDNRIDSWNGIPFMIEDNILDTEQDVY